MKLTLMRVIPSDDRLIDAVPDGTVLHDSVEVEVGDKLMTFELVIRVRPAPGLPSLLNASPRLQELLRFAPAALGEIVQAVRAVRHGKQPELPQVLVAQESTQQLAAG